MKRSLAMMLAVALLLSLFSACGVPDEVSGSPSGTDAGDPAPAPVPVYRLEISELMADNEKLCLGHGLDWVEIHNLEEIPVSLTGYYLTDVRNLPQKYSLEGITVPAEGYVCVVLDEAASLGLSAQGETLWLTCNGEIVHEVSFPASEDGESFSAEGACPYPTPGFANTWEGYLAYQDSLTLPELIISEAMSSNGSFAPVKGEFYDYAEVCNISDKPVSLKGYTLSDKRSEPSRYAFPDAVLAPGECFLVYCSGKTSLGPEHASFKISSSGESLYLSKNEELRDVLTLPSDLRRDESFGRSGKRTVYFAFPTPGTANGEGFATGLGAPTANLESGFYSGTVMLALTGEGTVYYTLDGSRPTENSQIYSAPIRISENTTVRTFCVHNGRSSDPTAFTYLFGQDHTLPVVSVAILQEHLTGEKGILNHIDQTYEYEGSVTLMEDGETKFSVPVGFRLHGNGSRAMPKQNFQLRFRSEYGASKLKYPLFEDRVLEEYDSLLLKGGSEDWNASVMRDELCTGLVDGTTALAAQAIKPVVLYLDGEYWGVYYLRERFNDDYVADHMGVSAESVDLLYSSGAYRQAGSAEEFYAIRKYVETHDMSLSENYAWLCERIDAVSLMDWYICRSYFGDKDTANIRRYRSSEGDGKWRWMFFDLDWAFYHTTDDPLTSISTSGGDNLLFRSLVASAEGKDAFLKRYGELLNAFLNEKTILSAIDGLADRIRPEMERDRARWGTSLASWESAVERLRNYVREGKRTRRVLEDLKSYFSLTDAEMTQYFGNNLV